MRLDMCIFLFSTLLCLAHGESILTNAMKKGVSKLGEACMKSVGATIEEVNTLKKGPPFQKKASCVLACIFDKAGIMEGKSFSKQGFMFAVTPFIFAQPRKIRRMNEISNDCDREINKSAKDECQAAGHIVQCLKKHIPQVVEITF